MVAVALGMLLPEHPGVSPPLRGRLIRLMQVIESGKGRSSYPGGRSASQFFAVGSVTVTAG